MADEIVLNSFTIEEEFGTPPNGSLYSRITATGFTVEEEFNTPPNGNLYSKITVNSFEIDEDFGTPPSGSLISVITAASFEVDEEFNTPPNGALYSRITLNSFIEDEIIGTPNFVNPGILAGGFVEDEEFNTPPNGSLYSKITTAGFVEDEAFGSPPATFDTIGLIVAGGFEVNVSFGRARIFQPNAAPVAPPGITRTILAPFGVNELGTSSLGKVYKDYTHHMKPHPITADVTRVFDESAVSGSLKNITLTDTGERPFSSGPVAGNIRRILFENATPEVEEEVKTLLFNAYSNYEPRAVVLDIEVALAPDQNSAEITVTWKMRGFEQIFEFTVFLERA